MFVGRFNTPPETSLVSLNTLRRRRMRIYTHLVAPECIAIQYLPLKGSVV